MYKLLVANRFFLCLVTVIISLPIMAQARNFSMGFGVRTDSPDQTPWPYVQNAGDVVTIQDDGAIPWDAALAGNYSAYPMDYAAILISESEKVAALPSTTRVFLYVNILNGLRTGVADYKVQGGTVPLSQTSWASKEYAFNDPSVQKAFLNHIELLIALFHPQYIAYGTEVNMMADAVTKGAVPPVAWTNFVSGAGPIYRTLKSRHPNTKVLFSTQTDYFNWNRLMQGFLMTPLWAFTDVIALTAYPYVVGINNPANIPADYFSCILTASGSTKPLAFAETGWAAEPVFYPDPTPAGVPLKYYIYEDTNLQAQYVQRILHEAYTHNTLFVDWYLARDFDTQWTDFYQFSPFAPTIRLFRDMGLWDGNGNARTAAYLWYDIFTKDPRISP